MVFRTFPANLLSSIAHGMLLLDKSPQTLTQYSTALAWLSLTYLGLSWAKQAQDEQQLGISPGIYSQAALAFSQVEWSALGVTKVLGAICQFNSAAIAACQWLGAAMGHCQRDQTDNSHSEVLQTADINIRQDPQCCLLSFLTLGNPFMTHHTLPHNGSTQSSSGTRLGIVCQQGVEFWTAQLSSRSLHLENAPAWSLCG